MTRARKEQDAAAAARADSPRKRDLNAIKGKHAGFYQGQERRQQTLDLIASGMQVKDAVAEVGVRYDTYKHWRQRYPDWAARVDNARRKTGGEEPTRHPNDPRGQFDLAREREQYFGHDTPDFQMEIVNAMEALAPGNILLVLLPPEHGKTTLFEDYANLKLGHDPTTRFHVGSESIALSKKILGRIKNRMDPLQSHSYRTYIRDFGPFAPPKDDTRHRQPWQEGYFDVFRKDHDERDYSMVALGFGSQIIGSRSDHLHCDDLQSFKTLSQTEKNFEKWRQDWLTRPGEAGRTTVMGNRVDEGDIYEAMMEALDPDILHVIRYPAILPNGQPLWPERWSLEQLDRMKRKVSDIAWDRNWQQRPRAKGERTFSQEIVDRCKNPTRPLEQVNGMEGRIAYIGLDPALDKGTNTLVAISPRPSPARGFDVVAARKYTGLSQNEQIMAVLQEMIVTLQVRGMTTTDVVIESKNFQAGLCRDERLLAMRDAYGFALSEHLTGWNKYDENIGVASMVTTFIKGEIDLPWADDEYTRFNVGELVGELLAWRPFKKGTKLRQDLVMALWFAWIKWRQRQGTDTDPGQSDQFKHNAMPYTRTSTGLVLPRGAYPSVLSGVR